MALTIPGAFAQSTDYPIDLPKRDGNLRNYYWDRTRIQVFPTGPIVHVFSDGQPEDKLHVQVGPSGTRQPGKTIISIPANGAPDGDLGSASPSGGTTRGHFLSNVQPRGPVDLHLQPASFHQMPASTNKALPRHILAERTPAAPAPSASGNNANQATTQTTLKYQEYPPKTATGASGENILHVRTTLTGQKLPQRGDLLIKPSDEKRQKPSR
jgi:hypothetical protein